MSRVRKAKPRAQIPARSTKTITTRIYGRDEEEITEDVEYFETEPAKVRIANGVTRSLADVNGGNSYEFVRVDVAIEVPCYREHVEATLAEVATQVQDELASQIEEYLE